MGCEVDGGEWPSLLHSCDCCVPKIKNGSSDRCRLRSRLWSPGQIQNGLMQRECATVNVVGHRHGSIWLSVTLDRDGSQCTTVYLYTRLFAPLVSPGAGILQQGANGPCCTSCGEVSTAVARKRGKERGPILECASADEPNLTRSRYVRTLRMSVSRHAVGPCSTRRARRAISVWRV